MNKKAVARHIPQFSKRYFEEYSDIAKLKDSSLFMVRQDGLMVYHKNGLGDKIEPSSIGALLGGLWQAAQALASFIPNRQDNEIFRLSFDTSNQGLYVQPLSIGDESYYLGLLYAEETNPALIKSKLRILTMNFLKYLEDELLDPAEFDSENSREEFLFENITDEEVDQLFKFAEM
jgi:hypothetical protein